MATTIDEPSTLKHETPPSQEDVAPTAAPARQLILGLVFGIAFGFLLQKGGVAKFHVLIGQLLLEDFTVVKVMLSAVIVGSIGIHTMHRLGFVDLHIKPTRVAANVIGGLIFGAGFALSAYCPGTGAAALGQGNYDAIAMIVGMIAGSYLFAEASGWIGKHINPIGDLGRRTLHDWIPANSTTVVISTAAFLVAVLGLIEGLLT
tara:strand:+ start:8336 stop:8947 length:612 start_codon:yes stop_codon:yes gene_type:complete